MLIIEVIIFHVSRRRCEMYSGHGHVCVCPLPRSYTSGRMDPDVSCALLGGFAVGAWVVLL